MIGESFILFNLVANKYVGKFVCLSYILAHRLHSGHPTVYGHSNHYCYLFNDNTPGVKIYGKLLFQLSREKRS